MELIVLRITDDTILFSNNDIALVIVCNIRLVIVAAVPLGVSCFLVLALGPHHHFDDLGAGDGFVRLEAVWIINRV